MVRGAIGVSKAINFDLINKHPKSFWKDKANQKAYLEWLGSKLQFKSMEDWYQLKNEHFKKHHGTGLLNHYNNSPQQVLMGVMSDHPWKLWKLGSRLPSHFWLDPSNVKPFMHHLALSLKSKYSSSSSSSPPPHHSENIVRDKKDVSDSEHTICDKDVELERQVSSSSSSSSSSFLSEKSETLDVPLNNENNNGNNINISSNTNNDNDIGDYDLNLWYHVTQADFLQHGGGSLLQKYGYSPSQILYTVFPQHEWLPWKFTFAPQNIWQNEKTCLKYMNWLGEKLGFTKMEDWYKVKQADFIQNDGKTLLSYYSLSPRLAVTSILKSHSWEPWKFGGKFQSLTNDDVGDPKVTTRIRNFVEEELKVQCKVTNLEDWYHVPPAVLDKVKRKALVQRSGGLIGLLKRAYPDHPWDWSKMNFSRKKTQLVMVSAIKELFPQHKIFVDYLHPSIVYQHNKENIELDAFIADLKLAFEFQGPHHYQRESFFKDLSEGDLAKNALCEQHGITLLAVPYWWDKKTSSLAFLINKVRPDLLVDYFSPQPDST